MIELLKYSVAHEPHHDYCMMTILSELIQHNCFQLYTKHFLTILFGVFDLPCVMCTVAK